MATFSHKLKTVEEDDHEKPQELQTEEPVRECIIAFVHMNMFFVIQRYFNVCMYLSIGSYS